MRALPKRRFQNRRPAYWTRERVLQGLLRFYREHGYAPTGSAAWQAATGGTWCLPPNRPYPSFASILRHFRSLRQAWAAAGVETDRAHEDFTPEEHWYIREAAGFLSREEIARDLRRTPLAIKSYLRDHGLHTYLMHGWGLHRASRLAGVSIYTLERYIRRGQLPVRKGTRCTYLQPVDLLVVGEIDWTRPPSVLEQAVRRELYRRLLGCLRRIA